MDEEPSYEITEILARSESGDEEARAELLPRIYAELRALAGRQFRRQDPGLTIQPTALVHEAFLKLTGSAPTSWESRAHFFAVAARTMRQILVDHARRKRAAKRGGEAQRVTLGGLATPEGADAQIDLLDLEEALAKLGELYPRKAQIVELRFLAGLEEDEIAHILGVSTRTIERDWRMARAFLKCELSGDGLAL